MTCTLCVAAPEPLWEGCGHNCTVHDLAPPTNHDNALHVTFSGGYGEFFDSFSGQGRAMLCHDCAHALIDREPWIAPLLLMESGHPHSHIQPTPPSKSGSGDSG